MLFCPFMTALISPVLLLAWWASKARSFGEEHTGTRGFTLSQLLLPVHAATIYKHSLAMRSPVVKNMEL